MTESDADPPGFHEWLNQLIIFATMTSERAGSISSVRLSPADRRGLREVFDAEVRPLPEMSVPASLARQLALANEAVTAVLADMHRSTPLRPEVVVDVSKGTAIRISVDGGSTTPSMFASERAQAFVEVADYFQEQLDEFAWPVCDRHDLGLHAEVHDGVAVWWCRKFRHGVAPVGSL